MKLGALRLFMVDLLSLHCAWCSYEMDGSTYLVRTTVGLNIPFADENTALSAGSV
jgi:hypothetical protein